MVQPLVNELSHSTENNCCYEYSTALDNLNKYQEHDLLGSDNMNLVEAY
ncbi:MULTISPECIES: hypothetical protein [unclassified Rickettsia]